MRRSPVSYGHWYVLDIDFVTGPLQKRLEFGPEGVCNLLKVIFAKAKVQKSL
jgi:hypothetical protein